MTFPNMTIFGIPISVMKLSETADYLESMIRSRKVCQVVTINPIMIMHGLQHPSYLRMLQEAELCVPDGAGVVWAASYTGKARIERVPGIDLTQELLQRSERQGYRVYLLGADRETISLAAANLAKRYPKLQLVGYRDGYFTDDQNDAVIEDIRRCQPDILLVGRSLHNQEPWIARHKKRLQVPVMMGVGGSFDIFAGKLRRAPEAFQRLNLEWLYRLLQEPRRFTRMLALPRFVLKVMLNRRRV